MLQKRVCWRFKVGGFTGETGIDDTVWLEAELESEEQAGWKWWP
ncbi:hypothetical protein HPL003_12810 [Paenibacillus terrae HPL-003]|uniref:Uncharacterized protein n=1 Tax=Paenibacillus terrae (strain HPL-003) TaxID=985665 RepID=G7VWB4_PAETH|nr:hypothetical protein [Paenibacillus terrae]AET59315.1 hypothetical protein HPL003_12810 [Paenibacillus terrae HPL-003]